MKFLPFSLIATGLAVAASADDGVQKLSPLVVNEAPSIADKYQLPQVTESISATRLEETVNAVDTEDAVKYFPSVFLRKRNYGDTQAVMATRIWGVSSSARSLIFADGMPLTALIANNNSIGGPRWNFVAPAEIERIDLMYGPFSAGYAGNSMGAVMEITTRQPDKFEASLQQTEARQHFRQYGTAEDFFHASIRCQRRRSPRKTFVLVQRQLSGQPEPAALVRHQCDQSGGY